MELQLIHAGHFWIVKRPLYQCINRQEVGNPRQAVTTSSETRFLPSNWVSKEDAPMRRNLLWIAGGFIVGVAATFLVTRELVLQAQQTERPGCSVDHPIDLPRDLSGLSIKI